MYERRVTGGQRDGHAGRNQGALARRQVHVLRREQIRAGVARMSDRGQREIRVQALDEHVDKYAGKDAGSVGGAVHGHHSSNRQARFLEQAGQVRAQHGAASSRPVTLSRSWGG